MQTSMKEFHSVGLYLCNYEPSSLTLANILSTKSFLIAYFVYYGLVKSSPTIIFYKIL